MEYLIEHFLKPGAEASKSGSSMFNDFTFDHILDGLVVGCRRDDRRTLRCRVTANVVSTEILWPADSRYVDYPPLAYGFQIDRARKSTERARRSGRGRRLDVAADE